MAQFGEAVLASPPKEGFNLLAWVLPLAGGAIAVAAVVRRAAPLEPDAGAPTAPAAAGAPLDPELERRLDDELPRFDG